MRTALRRASAPGARPAAEDDPVVGEGAVAELPFRGGEVTPELPDSCRVRRLRGRYFVRPQPYLPLAEGRREVLSVRAQHLHLEPGLEREHDLAQMGADRFGEQREDGIAERAAPSRCGAVRSVVVGDRLEAQTRPWGHPVEAPRE